MMFLNAILDLDLNTIKLNVYKQSENRFMNWLQNDYQKAYFGNVAKFYGFKHSLD